jgi:hypothetical protein
MIKFVADGCLVIAKVEALLGKTLDFEYGGFDESDSNEAAVQAEILAAHLNRSFEEFLLEKATITFLNGGEPIEIAPSPALEAYRREKVREAKRLNDEAEVQKCRVCGCTEDNPCVNPIGDTCHWAEEDLCSFCARIIAEAKKKPCSPKKRKSGNPAEEPEKTGEAFKEPKGPEEESLRARLKRTGRMPKTRDKEAVLLLVAECYGLGGNKILSDTRDHTTGRAKQLVAFLCCSVLKMSQMEVAKFLRTSAPNVFQKIKRVRAHLKDEKVKAAVNELTAILMALPAGARE